MKKRSVLTALALPAELKEALEPHVACLQSGEHVRHVARASGVKYHTEFQGWVVQVYRDQKLRRVLLCNDKPLAAYVAAASLLDDRVLHAAPAWVQEVASVPGAAQRWLASVDLSRLPPPRPEGIGRAKKRPLV